ncbi:MAG: hypothetical protein CFK48_09645 [Armatimonadetes bacterium CP1_7O]|nr:MAG: hypothetical protein CFK48_09645 [Armatimonadetes bacterium CP1_7O]
MKKIASLLAVCVLTSAVWAQEATSFQFKLTEKQRELFDATVQLDGNLPIPGAAGMAGTLKLIMTLFMQVDKVEEGKATVKTGLETFDAEFNGQPFPVGLDMARNVIPDSTAVVHPDGKLSGLQAGGGLMGFQLPGFDPRNMATLLFPTELPSKPLTNGATWQFTRVMGAGDDALKIPMTARYEGMEEYNGTKLHKVTQTFEQTIEAYQDAFYQPTTDKEAAVRVTKGVMKGTMTMWYHPETGLVERMTMQASLNQTTEPLKKDGAEVKDFERESSEVKLNASLTRKAAKPQNAATTAN